MKILRPTLLALSITLMISSTAFAGNIGGLRTTGNIGGMRSAGNIGGTRTTGLVSDTTAPSLERSRFELGISFSGTVAGLVRILLESGALL
jgi:hypothetical protein